MAIPVTFEQVTHNSPDGAQMGNATDSLNGFYGNTPVVQPANSSQAAAGAITATNPTAPAALTAAALTESSGQGTPNTTVVDVTGGVTDQTGSGLDASGKSEIDALFVLCDDNFADLAEMTNKLITDADAARTEQLTYETAISALVVDVTAVRLLTNQLRSELVTLGLIAGA